MARQWPGKLPPQLLLLGGVVIVVAGVAAVSASQVSGLKSQLFDRQRHIQNLSAQNQQLQQELAAVQTDRRDVEARLNDVRKELLSTTTELGRLRATVAELQSRYDTMAEERARMDARISELSRERDRAKEQARQLEDEKLDLERTAGRLRDRFAMLDRDYQQVAMRLEALERERALAASIPQTVASSNPVTRITVPAPEPVKAVAAEGHPKSEARGTKDPRSVELPPIVVRKDQASVASTSQGKVVEVNDQHQFVVVDKGSQDGVLLGMTVEIVRGTNRVGRARVVRVRTSMAACDIIRSETVGPIQVGDAVILQHLSGL